MDYLIRLQRLDLEGRVVSLSFPVCQLLLWMAPNHFHFGLLFDSDCFFVYTRLCVTSAWMVSHMVPTRKGALRKGRVHPN